MRFLQPQRVFALCGEVLLQPATVQVWPLALEGDEGEHASCLSTLSSEERARAERFYHQRDRTAYILSHGMMRQILGALCKREPSRLEFITGEWGKPSLSPDSQPRDRKISFNLSHSHGRALVAVCEGHEIGVDIEPVDSRTRALDIANSYFCGPELEAIRAAPATSTADVFFRYWAAKEAVLKAQGCGLGVPLSSFCILFDSAGGRARVDTADVTRIAEGWRVETLPTDSGWHAALAAGGDDWTVRIIGQT